MLSAEQVLFGFLDAKRELNIIEQKYEMVRAEMLPKSPTITDMPKSHSQEDKMAEMMTRLEEIQEQCLDARQKMLDRFEQVESIISKVDSALYRDILTERYILGKAWEVISEDVRYCRMHVWRLKKQALEEVGKLIDDCK